MKFKLNINYIFPLIIFIPIILSYLFTNEHFISKVYNTLIMPFGLLLVVRKQIRFNLISVFLIIHVLLGLLFIPYYRVYGLNDLFHIISYSLIVLSSYYLALLLVYNASYKLFSNIIIVYFTLVIIHHLFVKMGIGEGRYFWDLNFVSQRVIKTAVLSNIGNGKHITAIITSFAVVSILFSKKNPFLKILITVFVVLIGLLSFSRTFIFVIVITFFLWIFYRTIIQKRNRILIFAISTLSIIILFSILDLENLFYLFIREDFTNPKAIGRVQQFYDYLQIVREFPLTGTGWSSYSLMVNQNLDFGNSEIGVIIFVVEQGVLRSGIYIALILASLISLLLIKYKKLPHEIIGVLLISFISLLFGIVWGNNIVSDIRSLLFWTGIFTFIHVYLIFNNKKISMVNFLN